ncbi:antitoxin VapB family protein [Halopenitus salinus]|uniref:Antitoxin VapB family protein n=1 Tax=Halopenitus salinus TaxID=1198295 RepID=A0ABD5UNZ7_9EURY
MGTRNVRLDEDVYERIRSEKRPDETFSEAIDRLIGGASLLDLVGILSDEEADEFRRAIEESDDAGTREVDELVERFGGDDDP